MDNKFPSAINHLNYHPSMNNTKHPGTQTLTGINQAETLHKQHDNNSQPYVPKIQCGELTLSEEIFLGQILSALEHINSYYTKTFQGISSSLYNHGY